MTKKSYTQPTAVVVEMDTVDVLCTSSVLYIDNVTQEEVDWIWGEE